jgi:spermidine/putrescine transport system permease protein
MIHFTERLGLIGWRGFALLAAAFMAIPLALVVLFSFNQSALTSLPLTGFTLDWYRKLFSLGAFWPGTWNSPIVAAFVAILSVLIGTMAAMALARMARRRAGLLIGAVSIPMMLPALLIGVALMSCFVRLMDLPLGLPSVIIGHLVIAQPFVILIVYARLATFDWSVVDSARDLGASPLRAFLTVTLPIVRPTIVGAALIALSISLDDFVITFFTIGAGNTLPTLVWGMVRTSLDPTINAIASLLILLSGSTPVALRASAWVAPLRLPPGDRCRTRAGLCDRQGAPHPARCGNTTARPTPSRRRSSAWRPADGAPADHPMARPGRRDDAGRPISGQQCSHQHRERRETDAHH